MSASTNEPTRWRRTHTVDEHRDARPSPADVTAGRRAIPDDTRSLTGRLFGDPLPGRSALDARRISTMEDSFA